MKGAWHMNQSTAFLPSKQSHSETLFRKLPRLSSSYDAAAKTWESHLHEIVNTHPSTQSTM